MMSLLRSVAAGTALVLCAPVIAIADAPATVWQPGFTLAPYAWLAGLDGTVGSTGGDTGGGITLPPRLDVTTDQELSEIGFMTYGEWRGERWTAFVDYVWANVSQDADVKLGRILPSSDASVAVDGNIYQVGLGYRLFDWEQSFITVYGGGRFYDIETDIGIKGGLLPRKIKTSTPRSWSDAVFGARWSHDFGNRWRTSVLADYGLGDSESAWQIFGTVGYEFSWGSLVGGYRYMNLDYETSTYKVNMALSGPLLGASFRF